MSKDPERHSGGHERPTEPRDPSRGVDRRKFLQGMGAAGVVGAAGAAGLDRLGGGEILGPRSLSAAPPFVVQQVSQRPEGLRPGAQLDGRWPVSFAETIPQGTRLVTEFFAAWGQQDLEGMASLLHFPFAIIEQTEPIVFETIDDFMANPPMTLAPADMEVDHPGHFTGRIAPGSYNLFESIDVPLFCPVGAAVTLSFTRYNAEAYKLLEGEALFGVTNNDGRWGIELLSTILKPTDHVDVPHRDAEQYALRMDQDAMLRYTNRHRPREASDSDDRFYGRSATVNFGYGPRDRARDARNDQPMGWESAGVTSRLRISETRPEDPMPEPGEPDPDFPMFARSYDWREFADWAGGNVGTYGDTWVNPYQPRVLADGRQADRHKAHAMRGYIRHTPDLTPISETRVVAIFVRRDGRWGQGGSVGHVTYHDRSNSYPYVG